MLYPTQTRCGIKPDRAASSVTSARQLLMRIADPKQTPNIPLFLRKEAKALLRFFPLAHELTPVLRQELMMKDLPKLTVFPVWPEHEFD